MKKWIIILFCFLPNLLLAEEGAPYSDSVLIHLEVDQCRGNLEENLVKKYLGEKVQIGEDANGHLVLAETLTNNENQTIRNSMRNGENSNSLFQWDLLENRDSIVLKIKEEAKERRLNSLSPVYEYQHKLTINRYANGFEILWQIQDNMWTDSTLCTYKIKPESNYAALK